MDNPPDVEQLYVQAARCDDVVTEKEAAYHEAARQRASVYRALLAAGQSMYAVGRRLGKSTARVSQIVETEEQKRARREARARRKAEADKQKDEQ